MREEAVRLTPNGHQYKPTYLDNLGISLLRPFGISALGRPQ